MVVVYVFKIYNELVAEVCLFGILDDVLDFQNNSQLFLFLGYKNHVYEQE